MKGVNVASHERSSQAIERVALHADPRRVHAGDPDLHHLRPTGAAAAEPSTGGRRTPRWPNGAAGTPATANVVTTITDHEPDTDADESVAFDDTVTAGTSAAICGAADCACAGRHARHRASCSAFDSWRDERDGAVTVTVHRHCTGALTADATTLRVRQRHAPRPLQRRAARSSQTADLDDREEPHAATLTPGSDVTYTSRSSNAGPDRGDRRRRHRHARHRRSRSSRQRPDARRLRLPGRHLHRSPASPAGSIGRP